MIVPALAGFGLGLSLIVAIGAQNAFVLRQGLVGRHVLPVCLVCAASDAILIAAGVAGLGGWIAVRPMLLLAVTVGGAAFLFGYAAIAFRRAWQGTDGMVVQDDRQMLSAALGTALALTWLNPHVYLDTVLLLGILSARFDGFDRAAYAGGAMLASAAWFFALGYGARLLAPTFCRPGAWRVLDVAIGVVMTLMGIGLIVPLFQS